MGELRKTSRVLGASKEIPMQNGRVSGKSLQCTYNFEKLVNGVMVPRFWMSHVSFITKQSLACIPGPCGPKNASFCRNLLLCHFSAFSSLSPRLSLSSSPSFCQDTTDICAFYFARFALLMCSSQSFGSFLDPAVTLFAPLRQHAGRVRL